MDTIEKLKLQIEEYKRRENITEDTEDTDEDILLKIMTRGEISSSDLGGVIAIRGFIYQYYLTILKIVEMATSINKWDIVGFELFDDISLHFKEDKIRLIQVKTKKEEENTTASFTVKDLTERDSKKYNSWVDKLITNSLKYQDKTIELELAVNSGINNKISKYYNNDNFALDNFIPLEDDIYKKLQLNQTDDDGNIIKKPYSVQQLEESLKIFKCKNYGNFATLKSRIMETLKNSSFSQNNESDDSIFTKVIGNLLVYLIENTSNDNVTGNTKEKFFLKKSDIELFIRNASLSAIEILFSDMEKTSKQNIFETIFEKMQNEFLEQWEQPFQQELIECLVKTKERLEYLFHKDSNIYSRVINRILNLTDSSIYAKNEMDYSKLLESLRTLIYNLVFFENYEGLSDIGKLCFSEINYQVPAFSIYNANNNNKSTVKSKIYASAEQCAKSKKINHNYYCFIDSFLDDQGSLSFLTIADTEEDPKIVENNLYKDIIFIESSTLYQLMENAKKDQKKLKESYNSFKELFETYDKLILQGAKL